MSEQSDNSVRPDPPGSSSAVASNDELPPAQQEDAAEIANSNSSSSPPSNMRPSPPSSSAAIEQLMASFHSSRESMYSSNTFSEDRRTASDIPMPRGRRRGRRASQRLSLEQSQDSRMSSVRSLLSTSSGVSASQGGPPRSLDRSDDEDQESPHEINLLPQRPQASEGSVLPPLQPQRSRHFATIKDQPWYQEALREGMTEEMLNEFLATETTPANKTDDGVVEEEEDEDDDEIVLIPMHPSENHRSMDPGRRSLDDPEGVVTTTALRNMSLAPGVHSTSSHAEQSSNQAQRLDFSNSFSNLNNSVGSLGSSIPEGFDDDEVLEQYRIMALHEAHQIVQQRFGVSIEELRARHAPCGTDVDGASKTRHIPSIVHDYVVPVRDEPASTLPPPTLAQSRAPKLFTIPPSLNKKTTDYLLRFSREPQLQTGEKFVDENGIHTTRDGSKTTLFCVCLGCEEKLHVGSGATLVKCPSCQTVSPATTSTRKPIHDTIIEATVTHA